MDADREGSWEGSNDSGDAESNSSSSSSGGSGGSGSDREPSARAGKRERSPAIHGDVERDEGAADAAPAARKKPNKKRKDFDAPRTVFAGKIPYAADEDDIRTFFSECGTVTRMRLLLVNGKFNGAAFVEFSTAEEAHKALAMDGEKFLQRAIRVNMAELKPSADGSQTGFKVYVGNLAFTTSEKLLRAIFGHCGAILKLKLPLWRDTGRLRGFAVIDLDTQAARDRALKLNGMTVEGRVITVEPMVKKERGTAKRGTRKAVTIKSK